MKRKHPTPDSSTIIDAKYPKCAICNTAFVDVQSVLAHIENVHKNRKKQKIQIYYNTAKHIICKKQ